MGTSTLSMQVLHTRMSKTWNLAAAGNTHRIVGNGLPHPSSPELEESNPFRLHSAPSPRDDPKGENCLEISRKRYASVNLCPFKPTDVL